MTLISEIQLNILKEVLFGNQKQASVQNDAVVKIIASAMHKEYGEHFFDSSTTICEGITEFLQDKIDNGLQPSAKVVTMLIAGEDSVLTCSKPGPKVVLDEQPNPDSPKHFFRISMLDDAPTDPAGGINVDDFDKKMNPPQGFEEKPQGVDTSINGEKNLTYSDIVDNLVKEYAPLAPASAAAELQDSVKIALFAMSKLLK